MTAPLLRFELPDGRPATLLVGAASTVLSIGDEIVSSWDLCGRPYALVREGGTYRRGLDGGLLLKREARGDAPPVRCRLTAAQGSDVVEAARLEAAAALEALQAAARPDAVADAAGCSVADAPGAELRADPAPCDTVDLDMPRNAFGRLRAVVAMDALALADDAARFHRASGRVGILPPDQYLSIVVRVTEGCSWNACTFCALYRDVPFRFRPRAELEQRIAALKEYFGPSVALRRSVFLGDANALCLSQERLLPLLETVVRAFPKLPLYSFVDAWTGRRKSTAEWRACAELGVRRVYVGLETGDAELLASLGKPGTPADAEALVETLHEAAIAVGVVVLIGAGGERHFDAHVRHTVDVLGRMRLRRDDILYFSELVNDPSLEYGQRATTEHLAPLRPDRLLQQRSAITAAVRASGCSATPIVTYDLREFVY